MNKRLLGVLAAVTLFGAACGTLTGSSPSTSSTPSTLPARRQKATLVAAGLSLTPFDSCKALLAYVKSEADAEITPYGLPDPYPWTDGWGGGLVRHAIAGVAAIPAPAMAAAASGAANAGAQSVDTPAPTAGGFSTTNNQEAGVDELDSTKTDGRVLVTLRNGPSGQLLQVVIVDGTPRLAGKLALGGWADGLFLIGNEVVTIGQAAPSAQPGGGWTQPAPGQPSTQVTVVSIADPQNPAILRTFRVDGTEVAARLVGHSIKLVVSSVPTVAFSPPVDSTPAAAGQALATNLAAIASSTPDQWLPSVTDAAGVRHVADCAQVNRADQPQGLDTVSVVSIDPDQSGPGHLVTVLADAQSVYASPTTLYVAATNLPPVPTGIAMTVSPSTTQTVIHAFNISDPVQVTYQGSGQVPGVLLNQYSMSEWNGDLRVASTLGTPTPPPGEGGPVVPGAAAADQPGNSQSLVTVLRPKGQLLAPVGQVGGLGRGQKIFAVRFIGALGYVVTFRQLDPLYVLDLSDPINPEVRGALELSGYSAYLLPVDAHHLLGIGGSADANGRRTGLQVTLFDVQDPSHPAKVAQATIPGGYSSVEQDPHALLWWAPASLAVLPATSYEPGSASPFSGAIGYRIDPAGAGITEAGRVVADSQAGGAPCPMIDRPLAGGGAALAPGGVGVGVAPSPICWPGASYPITRDVVAGSRLYSLTEGGIIVSDVSTLQRISSLAFD